MSERSTSELRPALARSLKRESLWGFLKFELMDSSSDDVQSETSVWIVCVGFFVGFFLLLYSLFVVCLGCCLFLFFLWGFFNKGRGMY